MYSAIDNLLFGHDDLFQKSNKELKVYQKWFDDNKLNRIENLKKTVINSVGFEDWESDYSISSLVILSKWFPAKIETFQLSTKEIEKKEREVPEWIKVSDRDFITKTYSIIIDVGIYLGEVFSYNNNNIKWKQSLDKSNNRGFMVLKAGKVDFNPIWVTYITASKIAIPTVYTKLLTKEEASNALFDIYNVYMDYYNINK